MEGNVDWEKYSVAFRNVALSNNKSQEYCQKWLEYAKQLNNRGLPIIYNQEHLSALVGYKTEYLYAVCNSATKFYKHYNIIKKNGGVREISEPLPSLMEIQRWILDNILIKLDVSVYAKAYIKHKSIKENARFHKRQRVVLSLDVKKFFDSITSDKVYNMFLGLGYKADVVVMLTNICCLNGCLPQGAPTSPMISNIIMKEFDNELGHYTNDKRIRYTRYADDMTFSGDFNPGQVISYVKERLYVLGLELNTNKTRTRRKGQRQEITGIIVNEKMQIPTDVRKKIRQEMYYIKRYGLESHMQYCKIEKKNYLQHLRGKIQHGIFINHNDTELKSYLLYLDENYVD